MLNPAFIPHSLFSIPCSIIDFCISIFIQNSHFLRHSIFDIGIWSFVASVEYISNFVPHNFSRNARNAQKKATRVVQVAG